MRYVNYNGISGIDLSVPEKDLPALIKQIDKRIIAYFTDDFELAVRTPIGPDAIVTVNPLENKLIVRNMQEFEFSDKLKWSRWKYMVVSTLLENIQNSYGNTPYKEALDFISKIKSQNQSETKPSDLEKESVTYRVDKGMDLISNFLVDRISSGAALYYGRPIQGPREFNLEKINSALSYATENSIKRTTDKDSKVSSKTKALFVKVPKSFWKNNELLFNLIQGVFTNNSLEISDIDTRNRHRIKVFLVTGVIYESEPHHTKENVIVFKVKK